MIISLLLAALAGGCASYQRDEMTVAQAVRGDFGAARVNAQSRLTDNPGDRNYLLDRLKTLVLTLAEGVPEAAEPHADAVYQMLRTQGLNDDKTVPSFFFGEGGVRIWKGEPFEQAMGYSYVSVYEASRGNWGNARAAANNSIFLLRDFSGALQNSGPAQSDEDSVRQRERLIKAAEKSGGSADEPGEFPVDYRAVASDFELGYVLKAVSARALGDAAELNEATAQLSQVAPSLSTLAGNIRSAPFNTVIIADFGLAPRKIATGPDGAIASFRAITRSDTAPLVVRVGDSEAGFPVVTDLNRLARDLRWNNLEDLRLAKSTIGDVLIAGGLITAVATADKDNPTGALVGLGVAAVGAITKSTAQADTRHCEVLPQRVYVALLNLPAGESTVDLSIRGSSIRMVLPGMVAPTSGLALRYVRLPETGGSWATSGRVLYFGDGAPGPGPQLPWILGGRDVRTPSPAVMQDYYAAGLPRSITSSDLVQMYREEGISVLAQNPAAPFDRHILEAGTTLYSPQAGTAGFARLYGQEHAPYVPRSPRVRSLADQLRAGASSR